MFFFETVAHISLGITCFLAVAVVTHLLIKQREEKKSKDQKEIEFNQKIERLLVEVESFRKQETELLIQLEGNKQKIQQLELEKKETLIKSEKESQEIDELEEGNQQLLLQLESYKQRLLQLEAHNKELLTKVEHNLQRIVDLERENKELSIKFAQESHNVQQLEKEKSTQLTEIQACKEKIDKFDKINKQLLIDGEIAKKVEAASINASKFYEEFLKKGLDLNLDNLVEYKNFYRNNYQIIEDWNSRLELEKNEVQAGKIYEGNWGEKIIKLFSSEELDYIELEEQPSSSKGDKADFKLVFRNSKNKQLSTNSIRIMVELKYSFRDADLNSHFSITKSDLRKALEVAKYSPEPYHFIFLITNREFEIEEYRKSETIWVISDRDYQKFGLGESRLQHEPIIAIMTPEASFKWARMIYLLFWLSPTTKKVNIVSEEEHYEKLDQKIADFIRDCHSMTLEAEGVGLSILQVVEKFFSDLEKRFKQAKTRLLKAEKALNHVKDKNSTLWGEWKTINLGFADEGKVLSLPESKESES